MALVVAGERSGCGKTTVTLALLGALGRRYPRVQSFKIGPDYIDPMFQRQVTGRCAPNLDPVLTSPDYVRDCFRRHSQGAGAVVVEGVMGLFDGGPGGEGSTAQVARLLDLPVLLVVDCARLSGSVAALVHGYRSFDPALNLVGVVLNRVGSERHRRLLRAALAPLGVSVLGEFERRPDLSLPERHLGLVPPGELSRPLGEALAALGEVSFDWPRLLPLVETALPAPSPRLFPPGSPVSIALAQDTAFNFYYDDNLQLLEGLGAQLVPWSPLVDPGVPPGVQGVYLGGGFPEVFAGQLAANRPARESLGQLIARGMPTYAECGGLMYLSEQIQDFEGHVYPMVGALPTIARMGNTLTLGYRQVRAQGNSPLVRRGWQGWGHEFHRSTLSTSPVTPLYETWGNYTPAQREGWFSPRLHASYVHLHWGGHMELPRRFLQRCRRYLS